MAVVADRNTRISNDSSSFSISPLCESVKKGKGSTEGASSAPKAAPVGVPTEPPTWRTLVQACCERVSLLSTPTMYTEGCRFVNITEEEDFASSRGIDIAIEALKGPHDAIWFAPRMYGGKQLATPQ